MTGTKKKSNFRKKWYSPPYSRYACNRVWSVFSSGPRVMRGKTNYDIAVMRITSPYDYYRVLLFLHDASLAPECGRGHSW